MRLDYVGAICSKGIHVSVAEQKKKASLVLTMPLCVTRSIHTAVCWVEAQRPLQVLHPAVTRNGTSVAWHTGYNAHVRCAHIKKTSGSN